MSGESDHVCAFSVELLVLWGLYSAAAKLETPSLTDKELSELRDQVSMEPIQKTWPGHADLLMSKDGHLPGLFSLQAQGPSCHKPDRVCTMEKQPFHSRLKPCCWILCTPEFSLWHFPKNIV